MIKVINDHTVIFTSSFDEDHSSPDAQELEYETEDWDSPEQIALELLAGDIARQAEALQRLEKKLDHLIDNMDMLADRARRTRHIIPKAIALKHTAASAPPVVTQPNDTDLN
ncbi:hypothetical protein [Comamonas sp. B21-038]|uniref:hypothetical protein n=1 Tax=Comamonas sp. B21-038 TaxID=2918299 RepID=UPI001EFAD9A8|nr:hypothetical protein [Comamonas sp. B21-038]ULR89755.1 hypothetical protein MJ205_02360 [Comamonas sp. B21-038]